MAEQASSPDLHQDPLVAKLVEDVNAGPPDVVVLQGYLGDDTRPDMWRLYTTPELDSYVELPKTEILHHQEEREGGISVWVRKDLRLTVCVLEPAHTYAEFLTGPIVSARLPEATAEARGTAAALARAVLLGDALLLEAAARTTRKGSDCPSSSGPGCHRR